MLPRVRVDVLLRAVGVGGLLLLAVAFAPWFEHVDGPDVGVFDSARSWEASSSWGVASGLGVVAGALAWSLRATRRAALLGAVSLLPLLGLALVLLDRPVPPPPAEEGTGIYVVMTQGSSDRERQEQLREQFPIRRGQLLVYGVDGGFQARPAWGMWAGLLLLGGQAYALGGAALLARRS